MAKLLALMMVLLSCGVASAQDHIPHPGIGKCPSGQVVNQLLPNAGPPNGCTSVGGGTGTVTNLPQQVNGPAITSNTTTPIITEPTNTWFAQNYSGATADVKINACLTAAAASHGTCDATGLHGAQSIVATITTPIGTTLKLGTANYTSTILPTIQMNQESQVLCAIPNGRANTTNFTLSGTGAGDIIDMETLGASYSTVENCFFRGLADNDGSIGIQTLNASQVTMIGNTFATIGTGINEGGGAAGTYYTVSLQNICGGAVGTCFDYGHNANRDASVYDSVHTTGGAGTYGWRIENAATSVNIESPDCEPVPSLTSCLYIDGYGNTVSGAIYIAGAVNAFEFGADSFGDMIRGSGNITSVTNIVTYDAGANQTTDIVDLDNTSISPFYPQYIGTKSLLLSNGGSASQFSQFTNGSSFIFDTVQYLAGGLGETSSGVTGAQGLDLGNLFLLGGASLKGKIVQAGATGPATPTCTATCEPSDTANCASPATAYEYKVAGHDYGGGVTGLSGAATCTNAATLITAAAQNAAGTGAGTPLGCNTGVGTGTCVGELNTLTWTKLPGIQNWDIIGNQDFVHTVTTTHTVPIPGSIASPGTVYSYVDTNNSPSPYTPLTRQTTSDFTTGGNIIAGSPSAGCASSTQGCINATAIQVNGVAVGTGTVNSAAQWDDAYYSTAGTAAVLSGAAISGLILSSTSGAPAAYAGYTCAANSFTTALTGAGVNTCAQPTAANIAAGTFTGAFTFASAPTMSGANISATTIPVGSMNASGAASSTTYLRGDGSWSTPSGGSGPATHQVTTSGNAQAITASCDSGQTVTEWDIILTSSFTAPTITIGGSCAQAQQIIVDTIQDSTGGITPILAAASTYSFNWQAFGGSQPPATTTNNARDWYFFTNSTYATGKNLVLTGWLPNTIPNYATAGTCSANQYATATSSSGVTCAQVANTQVTGLGTSSTVNTGTSGTTLGLLNGNLTFGGTDTFSSPPTMSGANVSATTLPVGSINASGTPSSSTFLRGDGAWAAPSAGSVERYWSSSTSGTAAAIVLTNFWGVWKATDNYTIDNMTVTTTGFTCSVNPTVTFEDCGTSTTCTGPTALWAATLTGTNTFTPGTSSSNTMPSGDYFTFKFTGGTCTALDGQFSVAFH